jgi:peptidyl-tRNA hydrolase
MYLVLRRDLLTELKWPIGAVATQTAHAATACIWAFREDSDVLQYMEDLEHMRKVTLEVGTMKKQLSMQLQVKDETELRSVEERLKTAGVAQRMWMEDGQAVCLAVKPCERGLVAPLLRHLSLFR